jgi:CarboxypepD_reg-like domain
MADGSPLPNCSVFINNSSRGTISDPKGLFLLEHIPAGSYDLVISAIGYEIYTINFSSNRLPLDLKVKLKRHASELSAVTVEPFLKDGWSRWGKFFLENFIGTVPNAEQCRIKNRKSLRFRFSRKRGILTVFATEPLQIENKALGYSLSYQLEKFTYDESSHVVLYLGYSLFGEMYNAHKYRRQAWESERKKAYIGSMMHFMRSLYRDSLRSEGFAVTHIVKTLNRERVRVKASFDSAQKRSEGLNKDTLHYYLEVLRQSDYHQYTAPVPADSLLHLTASSEKSLFFRDLLTIVFTDSKENIFGQESQCWLLTPSPVLVAENGSYYPPQEVFTSGYWAHSEKIANLLPLDYELP